CGHSKAAGMEERDTGKPRVAAERPRRPGWRTETHGRQRSPPTAARFPSGLSVPGQALRPESAERALGAGRNAPEYGMDRLAGYSEESSCALDDLGGGARFGDRREIECHGHRKRGV